MSIKKIAILTTVALSLSYAKIDYVKFADICDSNISKDCKNIKSEIKAVQYLLKLKVNPKIKVNGVYDTLTKETIISIQKKEHLWARGYIGKKTKDALNKLLYGHKLHETVATSSKKDEKKSKVATKNIKTEAKKVTLAKNAKVKVTIKDNKLKVVKKETTNTKITKKVVKKRTHFNSYREFVKNIDLKKSYAVYQDPKLLKRAGKSNTLLKIDVNKQRVKLVVNGKVALDAPCTTGAKRKFEPNTKTYRDKRTPKGTFKIMEKIATKRSTIFGDIYKNGKKIYHGDRRKYRGSWKGVKFVGHPLKNWMRLTSGGIGLHASKYVKRYPGSNGCIRLQPKVAKLIFKKIKPGTKVKIN